MDAHAPYYPVPKAQELMGYSRVDLKNTRYRNAYWNRSDLNAERLRNHREEVSHCQQ